MKNPLSNIKVAINPIILTLLIILTFISNQAWSSKAATPEPSGKGTSVYNTIAFATNMVNGNMYHEETDIILPARGLPLIFKRTYNSRTPENGPLGWGWTHSFNQSLQFADTTSSGKADTIIWTNGTGSRKYITLQCCLIVEQ